MRAFGDAIRERDSIIEVQGGGSLSGLNAVTSQQADIGDSDVFADPAIYSDPNLTDHIVCVIPFAMVVAPSIPILSLTRQQIIDIFSGGKIRNWKELNGPDIPIVPIVRPATSGTRAIFRKYILGGRDERGTLLTTDSSTAVRDKVVHTPGAIGYLARSVLDSSVHTIAIDGQAGTSANVEAGHYPFWATVVACLAIALVGWFISNTIVTRLRQLRRVTQAVEACCLW